VALATLACLPAYLPASVPSYPAYRSVCRLPACLPATTKLLIASYHSSNASREQTPARPQLREREAFGRCSILSLPVGSTSTYTLM